jgi:hypothetical protein
MAHHLFQVVINILQAQTEFGRTIALQSTISSSFTIEKFTDNSILQRFCNCQILFGSATCKRSMNFFYFIYDYLKTYF